MSLYDDAKKIILELFGPKFLSVLDTFEDPKKYPEEFLNEFRYFLEMIIGKEATEEKVKPLYEKYTKAGKSKKKLNKPTSFLKGFSCFLCGRKIPKLLEYNLNPTIYLLDYQLHILLRISCNKHLLYS